MTDIFPRDFTFENYTVIIEKSRVLQPLINSIKMSIMAVVAGLIITVPVSYLVVKKNNIYNKLAKFLIMLPWSMPASVIAINLINSFNQKNIFAFNESLIGGFYILPLYPYTNIFNNIWQIISFIYINFFLSSLNTIPRAI